MRTTLNIDDDLMLILKRKAVEESRSLTEVVNEVLMDGIKPAEGEDKQFQQKTYSLGVHPGINLNKALDLAAELETRYTSGKMEIGK